MKRSIVTFFKFALLAICILIVVLVITSCGKTTIKVADYVDISVKGGNGYATPTLKVDTTSLDDEYPLTEKQKKSLYNTFMKLYKKSPELQEEMPSKSYYEDLIKSYLDDANLSNFVVMEFAEEYENVSNDDELRVIVRPNTYLVKILNTADNLKNLTTPELEEILGVSFKECVIKVSGLADLREIDIFSYIEPYYNLDFFGTDDEAAALFSWKENVEELEFQIDDIYFTYKKYSNLEFVVNGIDYKEYIIGVKDHKKILEISFSIRGKKSDSFYKSGDQISLIINGTSSYSSDGRYVNDLMDYGYVLKSTEKSFTIPELGHYAKSASELTPSMIDDLRKKCFDKANESNEGVEEIGCYVGTLKPTVSGDDREKTAFVFVFYRTGHRSGVFSYRDNNYTFYKVFRIIIKDGELADSTTLLYDNYNFDDVDSIFEYKDQYGDNKNYNFTEID